MCLLTSIGHCIIYLTYSCLVQFFFWQNSNSYNKSIIIINIFRRHVQENPQGITLHDRSANFLLSHPATRFISAPPTKSCDSKPSLVLIIECAYHNQLWPCQGPSWGVYGVFFRSVGFLERRYRGTVSGGAPWQEATCGHAVVRRQNLGESVRRRRMPRN